MPTLSLRAIFLLGFVIVMPLLALPAVARRLDGWLYGPPPGELAQRPEHPGIQPAIQPLAAEQASPASFEQIDTSDAHLRRQPHEGLDALTSAPPPLSPLPAFEPVPDATRQTLTGTLPPITPLDEADSARLEAIRQSLEGLGAEYILLEATDTSGDYRFHCLMPPGDGEPAARPFEATSPDPLAAAERVLADVSAWRISARGTKLR